MLEISLLIFKKIVPNFRPRLITSKITCNRRKYQVTYSIVLLSFTTICGLMVTPISNDSVLASLPEKLRAEIGIYVHMDTLKKVAFFERCETSLLSDLVLCLTTEIYLPGDYVCRKGDVGHEMYIVNRGKLEVLEEDTVTVKAVLTSGSYFGEISILDLGETHHRRTANVRSVGYSDLLCLSQHDLIMVLKNYPKTLENLRRAGKTILEEEKKRQQERASRCTSVHTLISTNVDYEQDDDGDSDSDDEVPCPAKRTSTTKRVSHSSQPHNSIQGQVMGIHNRMNSLEQTMKQILSHMEKLQEKQQQHDNDNHDKQKDGSGSEESSSLTAVGLINTLRPRHEGRKPSSQV